MNSRVCACRRSRMLCSPELAALTIKLATYRWSAEALRDGRLRPSRRASGALCICKPPFLEASAGALHSATWRSGRTSAPSGEALVGRWPAPRRKARAAGGVGVLRSRASHRPGLPALRVVLEDRYACEAPAGGSTLSENVALLGDGKGLVPTVPFVGPPSPGP
jgi:hypothetical protein